jgi:hypothetical protein
MSTKKRTMLEMRRDMPYGKNAKSIPVSAKTKQKEKMPAAITVMAWPKKNLKNVAILPYEPNTTTGNITMEKR